MHYIWRNVGKCTHIPPDIMRHSVRYNAKKQNPCLTDDDIARFIHAESGNSVKSSVNASVKVEVRFATKTQNLYLCKKIFAL